MATGNAKRRHLACGALALLAMGCAVPGEAAAAGARPRLVEFTGMDHRWPPGWPEATEWRDCVFRQRRSPPPAPATRPPAGVRGR